LFGRQTGFDQVAYGYNALGQRVSKTADGVTTRFVWDGDYIVWEQVGTTVSWYVYGVGRVKSNTAYYLYNAHGDVVQLSSNTGAVTRNYTYDAFGVEQDIDAADTNPWRYCGEYFDKETGNIYLRARYYDPVLGRFTQEDPIGDGLNWYTYCNNNPIIFIDPFGLMPSILESELKGELPDDLIASINTYYRNDIGQGFDDYLPWDELPIANLMRLLYDLYKRNYPDRLTYPMLRPKETPSYSGEYPEITYYSQVRGQYDDEAYFEYLWGLNIKPDLDVESGCAIASVAMALSSLGYHYTPYEIYDFNNESVSMTWSSITKHLPLNSYDHPRIKGTDTYYIPYDSSVLTKHLDLYRENPEVYSPVILGYRNDNGSHYVVVYGYNADGGYLVHDPLSRHTTVWNGSIMAVRQYYRKVV